MCEILIARLTGSKHVKCVVNGVEPMCLRMQVHGALYYMLDFFEKCTKYLKMVIVCAFLENIVFG